MWTIGQIYNQSLWNFILFFYVVMDIKVGNIDFYCTKMMVSV